MDEQELFESPRAAPRGWSDTTAVAREPLAERMRPKNLDEMIGQDEALGRDGFLRSAILQDAVPSMVLWGPPGSGKTSLARVVANSTSARFIPFSAVLSGVKEIRLVVKEASALWRSESRRTILFVDEIHRFNKAQQDAFLPHVEAGTITLIGATTENPFFEVTSPLLSRCRVVRLEPLGTKDIVKLARRAMEDVERGLGGRGVTISDPVLEIMAKAADGDGRRALNLLEAAVDLAGRRGLDTVSHDLLDAASSGPSLRYDRAYEEHYNVISAFIKSMRGSDPDAALYYMARMLEGGEDPAFVCRRMIIFASEDISNADPRALQVAVAAKDAWEYLGMPEAAIPMAQAATYLATAPKSNASYRALREAQKAVRKTGSLEVPMHIRNAPVKGMAAMGYGQGYAYPHDYEGHWLPENYLPEALRDSRFYEPSEAGYERHIRERLDAWRKKKGRR
ncbi:MAG: replication-associated recombination protein A [Deltaproteobacteria bacterium]|nr:replication-associated recombination protein A [Deltaproteobacteria bacterium]